MDDIFTFFNTGAQCRMICIIRLSVIFLLESRCNTASVGMSCILLYIKYSPYCHISLISYIECINHLRNIIYAFCFRYELFCSYFFFSILFSILCFKIKRTAQGFRLMRWRCCYGNAQRQYFCALLLQLHNVPFCEKP